MAAAVNDTPTRALDWSIRMYAISRSGRVADGGGVWESNTARIRRCPSYPFFEKSWHEEVIRPCETNRLMQIHTFINIGVPEA